MKNPQQSVSITHTKKRRHLNCGDFYEHPDGAGIRKVSPEPLLSCFLPAAKHLLQRSSRIKKNREQREASEQLTTSSHTGIGQKWIGSTVQISRVQYKTWEERKNWVTSGSWPAQAVQTDQTHPQSSEYSRERGEYSDNERCDTHRKHVKIFLCFKDFA